MPVNSKLVKKPPPGDNYGRLLLLEARLAFRNPDLPEIAIWLWPFKLSDASSFFVPYGAKIGVYLPIAKVWAYIDPAWDLRK